MSVLLPNATLGVRRRVNTTETNSHGEAIPAGWGPVLGMLPGRVKERADGGFALGVDLSMWPISQGDLIIAADGRSWLVNTADPITNNYDHRVDWARIDGQQRSVGGTEPGGAWFVGRYADALPPPIGPPDPNGPPVLATSMLWTGYGPPPETWDGLRPGQEYMDLNTGAIYVFGAS